jgi:hypothetical protein
MLMAVRGGASQRLDRQQQEFGTTSRFVGRPLMEIERVVYGTVTATR